MAAVTVRAVFHMRVFFAEHYLFCKTFARNSYVQNTVWVSPLLACGDQEEEESPAETGKEEQGEKQDEKSSAEDAGEEQGEEKQPSPGQAETAPPKAESQKKEEGEKLEPQVSIRLKERDCDFGVRGACLKLIKIPTVLSGILLSLLVPCRGKKLQNLQMRSLA